MNLNIDIDVSRCSIDKLDCKILSSLQGNALLGDVSLAQVTHLSPSAVGRRRKALNDKGVIEGYRLILDLEKLGLATTMLTFVQLDQHSPDALTAFEQFVGDHLPFVVETLPLCGSWDYQLRIVARSNSHYGSMLKRLGNYQDVVRVRTYPIMGRGTVRPVPLDLVAVSGVGSTPGG